MNRVRSRYSTRTVSFSRRMVFRRAATMALIARASLLGASLRNLACAMMLTAIERVANPIASVAVTNPVTRKNCVGVTAETDSPNTVAVSRQTGDWLAFSSNACLASRRASEAPGEAALRAASRWPERLARRAS